MNTTTRTRLRRFDGGALLYLAAFFFACAPIARALVIIPTFDGTITTDPNAVEIENSINLAIQYFEARFSDPITVTIAFQEITTAGVEGHSSWWYIGHSYSEYRAALAADSTTPNDVAALAALPNTSTDPGTGSGVVRVKTANLKALGYTGVTSGLVNGLDGIIGLHTSDMNLSRTLPPDPYKYDLVSVAEHEIDEVLGLGSGLDSASPDPFPEDLFRYAIPGLRSYTSSGDDAYFSINGTQFLARFNQDASHDFGDWWTAGQHTPQVQDAVLTSAVAPNPGVELIALDAIGYDLVPLPAPGITGMALSGTQLTINGTNGLAGGHYFVLSSTNATAPVQSWPRIAISYVGTNGNFVITVPNAINPGDANRFFALQLDY